MTFASAGSNVSIFLPTFSSSTRSAAAQCRLFAFLFGLAANGVGLSLCFDDDLCRLDAYFVEVCVCLLRNVLEIKCHVMRGAAAHAGLYHRRHEAVFLCLVRDW